MKEWILQNLADRLDVAPPQAGEEISPHIRLEQPWEQWLLIAVVLGSSALVVWLYRREGKASLSYKSLLATIRICLILLVVFMLSEAVLSVQRTGLPYMTIMIDDSASERIADQYEQPETRTALEALAKRAAASSPASPAASREPGEITRLDIAKGLILKDHAALIQELQKQHKVRLYLVSNSARLLAEVNRPAEVAQAVEKLVGVEATGSQSRLGDGTRQVLTELRVPPSAIVLLTDGQTTEGEPLSKAAELAARKGVPLFTIGLGSAEPARDLELTELLVDDIVFVDDAVRFQAKLLARGLQGQKVVVRLKEREPGSRDARNDRELESIEVEAPPDGQPRRVELVHRPKTTGERSFVLEVVPRPRELQVENNRIERVVTVRKEKLKVLLVETEPRYEFRYLKNYLEREETIDLGVVLLSSDPEYSDQDRSALPTFPAAKDELFAYDVVIIGDADPGFLSHTQMQNLVEFVSEKGGGILFIAGEIFNPLSYRGTPLESLLPIELSAEARNPTAVGNAITSYRPELTVEGRSSPIFRFGESEAASAQIWQSLPELYWYFEAPRKRPAALVLAEHPTVSGTEGKLALDLYQFAGFGKTMFHAFDDTWRWRFRAGDRYFGRFWVQAIRFLARSKLVGQRQAEIQTDRRRYERGQPIRLRVRFPNPGLAPAGGSVTVQVERNGLSPRKLTLNQLPGTRNVFEGALPQAPEGDYEVRLLPPPILEGPIPTASFRVEAPASEFERVQMNEPELIRTAAATGGKFYTPLTADTLLQDLPKPSKVPLDTDPSIPLWNTWPVLSLFLILITLEWVLRKRKQMV